MERIVERITYLSIPRSCDRAATSAAADHHLSHPQHQKLTGPQGRPCFLGNL
jgi:hypothetical protein